MMLDPEIQRLIKQEVQRQLNIITSGLSGNNTTQTETIEQLYPGMPNITDRPIMHPYGFVSRAPRGTLQVTAQQGSHPGNKMVVGHRDKDKPDLDDGDSAVYSVGGYIVRLKGDSITLGKDSELETMVVGETLVTFLTALLDAIIAHKHVSGAPGSPTAAPMNVSDFMQLKTDYLANGKVLAKDGGRF